MCGWREEPMMVGGGGVYMRRRIGEGMGNNGRTGK
jgi:hypothetical protein